MRELIDNTWRIIVLSIALALGLSLTSISYEDYTALISPDKVHKKQHLYRKLHSRFILNRGTDRSAIIHKRVKRWLNGKPAIVNIIVINPKKSGYIVKPSFGSYFIDNLKGVKDIVRRETGIGGINATYFKPDSGAPLGTSIVDGELITGPLFRRVTFGMTDDMNFKMQRVDIKGEISIGNNIKLKLFNLNQPVFSSYAFTVFTDKWGKRTPRTSPYYSHIVVKDDRVQYVKNSSVIIPRGGYAIVGPHKPISGIIQKYDSVDYTAKLTENWDDVEYAVGGGPYLVKKGRIFIDQQYFASSFLWSKYPRTAIGYTKSGNLIMVTVDGRHKKFSEGATLPELAHIMYDLGAYNAMNLDGGTSTQMVFNGKLVNYPSVKGGSRVNNALVIVAPVFAAE